MNEEHIRKIGRFYIVVGNYMESFKVGGKQKLKNLIGEELFYQKGKLWFFNNPKICSMQIEELDILINKLEKRV
jgi:hypothetical protein